MRRKKCPAPPDSGKHLAEVIARLSQDQIGVVIGHLPSSTVQSWVQSINSSGQRRVSQSAVPPRCDPTCGQRGEQCSSFSPCWSSGGGIASADPAFQWCWSPHVWAWGMDPFSSSSLAVESMIRKSSGCDSSCGRKPGSSVLKGRSMRDPASSSTVPRKSSSVAGRSVLGHGLGSFVSSSLAVKSTNRRSAGSRFFCAEGQRSEF